MWGVGENVRSGAEGNDSSLSIEMHENTKEPARSNS